MQFSLESEQPYLRRTANYSVGLYSPKSQDTKKVVKHLSKRVAKGFIEIQGDLRMEAL